MYLFRPPRLLYLLQHRIAVDYIYNTLIFIPQARLEGRRADENSGLAPRDMIGAAQDFRSRRQEVGGCNRRSNRE